MIKALITQGGSVAFLGGTGEKTTNTRLRLTVDLLVARFQPFFFFSHPFQPRKWIMHAYKSTTLFNTIYKCRRQSFLASCISNPYGRTRVVSGTCSKNILALGCCLIVKP